MDVLFWSPSLPSTDLTLSAHFRVLCVISTFVLALLCFHLQGLGLVIQNTSSTRTPLLLVTFSNLVSTTLQAQAMSRPYPPPNSRPNKRARYLDQQSARPRPASSGNSAAVLDKAKQNLATLFDTYRGKLSVNFTTGSV